MLCVKQKNLVIIRKNKVLFFVKNIFSRIFRKKSYAYKILNNLFHTNPILKCEKPYLLFIFFYHTI